METSWFNTEIQIIKEIFWSHMIFRTLNKKIFYQFTLATDNKMRTMICMFNDIYL